MKTSTPLFFNPAKISRRRKALGLTQEKVARRSNLSITTVVQLEGGKKEPLVNTLAKVAAALRVRISYFFEKQVA